jgi:hypothetical protein
MKAISATPLKFDEAGIAIGQLQDRLEIGRADGVTLQDPGILTFAALRVVGPAGTVLVSAGPMPDGKVVFFAPPLDAVSGSGINEVIGTPDRVGEVAGIIRRRVTASRI